MNKSELLQIAMMQSAIDANCSVADFYKNENVISYSKKSERARKYLELPFACNLTSYGSNIVASILPEYEAIVREYIGKYSIEHCFETPNIHVLNEAFLQHGYKVCFMAEYFLPDLDNLPRLDCAYETRVLTQKDFAPLYVEEWSNALCADRKELDVLGVAAYDGDKMVGFAACSADCGTMWQIGVDVLPDYRKKGIASALTNKLTWEILAKEKVPFYCCAWSNIKSARNAIKSGFKPAWAELTVKPVEFVDKMNHGI